MDINTLGPRDRVRTVDGALVEVLKETEDGKWILVRYLEEPENPGVVGTEDLCHADELGELVEPQEVYALECRHGEEPNATGPMASPSGPLDSRDRGVPRRS